MSDSGCRNLVLCCGIGAANFAAESIKLKKDEISGSVNAEKVGGKYDSNWFASVGQNHKRLGICQT